MQEEQQLVYWFSGLYLQPQHFQSTDLHHSFMLARTRQLSQPYNQGYYEHRINDELLNEYTVRVEKIKAVLSSGYYLEFPGNCVLQDKCLTNLRDSEPKRSICGLLLNVLIPRIQMYPVLMINEVLPDG